ncbi:Uncharacterised protein [Brucella anthropi]|nr:Uncharacterised protein [Brucella anthropi]
MRFFKSAVAASGTAACVWAGFAGVAHAASTVTLVPHRAVYDLTLDRADEKIGDQRFDRSHGLRVQRICV